MIADSLAVRGPLWLPAVAGLGVLWNAYGVYQFADSFSQNKASLMAVGMTALQADVYLSLPAWISVVFAIGVFGGLIGSLVLFFKKAIALPIFAVSFAGYILLFAGDVYYGVFDAIPAQLAILTMVVAIAAALLGVSWYAKRKGVIA